MSIAFIGRVSRTTASLCEKPSKQWPPLRSANGIWCNRSHSIIAATARWVLHRARSLGRNIVRRLKAASYRAKRLSFGVSSSASASGRSGRGGRGASAAAALQPESNAGAKTAALASAFRQSRLVRIPSLRREGITSSGPGLAASKRAHLRPLRSERPAASGSGLAASLIPNLRGLGQADQVTWPFVC